MKQKEYTNGEVTIVWKADRCYHSEKCVKGLPSVFNASKKPWIDPEGASTEKIIAQVKECPSGALSYYMNAEGPDSAGDNDAGTSLVEVLENGPLIVNGDLTVQKVDGTEETKATKTAFCRCGASSDKPYCDGSHRKINFQG